MIDLIKFIAALSRIVVHIWFLIDGVEIISKDKTIIKIKPIKEWFKKGV